MTKDKTVRRGRKPLPKGEKKATIAIFVEQKVVDLLTYEVCREVAEQALQEKYGSKIA
jgi:hypothetical protein